MDPLADKYPSAARQELRSELLWPTVVCLAGAVILVLMGATQLSGWRSWAAFGGAALLGVVVWGFRTLRPWSRWVVAVFGAAAVVGNVGLLLTGRSGNPALSVIEIVVWGGFALYFAHPATGRRFALARSRWTPRARGGRA